MRIYGSSERTAQINRIIWPQLLSDFQQLSALRLIEFLLTKIVYLAQPKNKIRSHQKAELTIGVLPNITERGMLI